MIMEEDIGAVEEDLARIKIIEVGQG